MSEKSSISTDGNAAPAADVPAANDEAIPTAALETLRSWSCTPEIVEILEGAARALEELTRREAA